MRYVPRYSTTSCLFVAIYFCGYCVADSPSNTSKHVRNETMFEILKRDLFANYDKFTRPSEINSSTKVGLGMRINHIELDESKGVLTVYGWQQTVWSDPNFTWDPQQYDGIKDINIPTHEIWQPDITAYNSAAENVDYYGNTLSIAKFNGQVLWVPPFEFKVFCELDFTFWPFDSHKCTLRLGSWAHGTSEIELHYEEFGEVNIERFIENHEWVIKGVNRTREIDDCCVKPIQYIKFEITIERRSPMYSSIVITPASCVILLTLSCFWLPAQAGEKILLNGINIIMIFAFMMYFAQKLPSLAISTPLIILFYNSSLILVSLSMVISVVVLHFANTRHQRSVPSFLKNILNGPICIGLCLKHVSSKRTGSHDKELQDDNFENHATDEEQPTIADTPKQSIQHDWLLVATAIDRIFFFIYCVVFIVLAITYSV